MPTIIGRLINIRAKRHFVLSFATLLLIASAPALHASTIILNFNDGANGDFVGNFYAASGVTFSANTQWSNFASTDEAAEGVGGLKITDFTGTFYQPKVDSPLVATFSTPVSTFSIRGVNVGGNGVRVEAYDAAVGGNLVAFDQNIGTGDGIANHPLITLTPGPSTSIRRVVMYQPLSALTEGVLFDNMSFTPIIVPEPATALLALAFILSAAGSRRKRQPTASYASMDSHSNASRDWLSAAPSPQSSKINRNMPLRMTPQPSSCSIMTAVSDSAGSSMQWCLRLFIRVVLRLWPFGWADAYFFSFFESSLD